MRLLSIRTRLTFGFCVSTGLLVLVAWAILVEYARSGAEQEARSVLSAAAIKVAGDLAETSPRVDSSDLDEDIGPGNMALRVTGSNGETLFQSQQSSPRLPSSEWRTRAGQVKGSAFLLALPQSDIHRELRRQAVILAALGLFLTGATGIGAWMLVGKTLDPIAGLSAQARAASAESPRLRLDAPSQDMEILELVSTLNGLLSRIGETVTAKERFHAAASHELRTPLQALSGQLELALSKERSPEEYRKFIAEATIYAHRLIDLTRDLLLLHQLDSARPPAGGAVDLGEVCWMALAMLKSSADARCLRVTMKADVDATLHAPATHAEMLVRNLLENAISYSSEHGAIAITVARGAGSHRLEIYNECEPSDAGFLRLLEPFGAPDRPSANRAHGTGLGLAICKAIADSNGWRLDLDAVADGVVARIVFPLSLDFNPVP